jgi:hypothetical protein
VVDADRELEDSAELLVGKAEAVTGSVLPVVKMELDELIAVTVRVLVLGVGSLEGYPGALEDDDEGAVTASVLPVEKIELEESTTVRVSVLVLRAGKLVVYPGE